MPEKSIVFYKNRAFLSPFLSIFALFGRCSSDYRAKAGAGNQQKLKDR